MRPFPILLAVGLGLTLARPSPKISTVHKPHERPSRRGISPRQQAANLQARQADLPSLPTDQTNLTAPAPSTSAPFANPWLYLSNDEAAGVIAYLHNDTVLNLTAVADAGNWDNTILVLDLLAPNKSDVLSFLDNNGTAPARHAVASILFAATEEPYVQEFVVGPLPVDSNTSIWPNTWQSQAKDGKIRVFDMDSSHELAVNSSMQMVDIINDLLNATIQTSEDLDNTFDIWGIDPLWHQPGDNGVDRVISWVGFWRYPATVTTPSGAEFNFDGETLLPQGLYLQMDITGRDPSQWYLKGILYGDEYYTSIDDFRLAWQQPDFFKAEINYSGDWVGTDKTETAASFWAEDTMPPPVNVQPSGQRFKVDEEQKYVEWMDFTFYLTFTRDTGMRFYDIKYKGERIIYELGLQEAVAHYAGNDPVQSGTSYLDTYYGFGPYAFSQVPGYDMPNYATCINSTFHASEISKSHRCGITVFEADTNYLLQRHSSQEYVSATKNIALYVRSVSTVGNYDYNFDYVFYLDGSIETVVRASGYIQSAFYANNTDYGYQIHDALSGSMHDHSLNYKVDFDILGINNTMTKHIVEPTTVKYKWNPYECSTMHLVRKDVTNEDEGKMNWSANAQEQVLIVNKDAPNKYGEERGYKIMPSRGGAGMHLTITNSSNLLNSQGFATHAYYVTKQKDSEPRASSAWNDYDTANPLVDFNQFFDGESLYQEDIVMWYNLGMHHVPHTGDLPNTVFTTAQSGMFITPHNYLLGDASRQSSQMIRINYTPDNVTDVNTFGQEEYSGQVDLAQTAWDPMTYAGDVAVRKFPYDPQNPYNDTESIV